MHRLKTCATKGGGHGGPPHQTFYDLRVGQVPMNNCLNEIQLCGQQASIIDERPDSGQRHYRRADGKRPAAAIPSRRRAWLDRYPGNQGPGKIELDFTRLAINLSFTKKSRFTLKRKG